MRDHRLDPIGPGSRMSFHEERALQRKREKQLRWDTFFLGMAVYVSTKSKDQSTKCGCVIVDPDDHDLVSTGYNGLPPGVNDDVPERQERPEKYLWFEHAERNAVYFAASRGKKTKGCTSYVTAPPCADCARAFIRAGIRRVVVPKNHNMRNKETSERWQKSVAVALQMFMEAGVQYVEIEFDAEYVGRTFHEYTETYEEQAQG